MAAEPQYFDLEEEFTRIAGEGTRSLVLRSCSRLSDDLLGLSFDP